MNFKHCGRHVHRFLLWRVLPWLWVASGALMCHTALQLAAGTTTPLLVAMSGGLMFGPSRGDLFLIQQSSTIEIGHLVAFTIPDRRVPIVHRVVEIQNACSQSSDMVVHLEKLENQSTCTTCVLTKGDDNRVNDRGLYPPGQMWLAPENVLGKVVMHLPGGGFLSMWMHDAPWLRWMCLVVGSTSILQESLSPRRFRKLFWPSYRSKAAVLVFCWVLQSRLGYCVS